MVNLSQIPKALQAVYSYSNNPHLQINTHLTGSWKHKAELLPMNEDQNEDQDHSSAFADEEVRTQFTPLLPHENYVRPVKISGRASGEPGEQYLKKLS